MVITSVNNDKIKEIDKIKKNNKDKKFIVETMNLVEEANKAGILEYVLSTKELNINVPVILVSDNVMKHLSSLKNSYVIGICKFNFETRKIGNKVILLDNLQDPGNLGTIIRSSVAFNFDTIILSKTCVKPYNDKVIRSSEGMIFKTNIIIDDLTDVIEKLKKENYKVYKTDVNGGILIDKIEKSLKIAFVIGNEGNGISNEVSNIIEDKLYINMNSKCESLNAAVAASIIMYELSK